MTTATGLPGTTTRRLDADRPDLMEALLIGAGAHLEPVLDVGTAANGDLLLVHPAPAHRLADLLRGPAITTAGEAVTVLIPLAQALQRLHDAGAALDGVDGAAVVLDGDGSPAWSPRRAVLLRRVGPAAFAAAVQADLAGFARLADGLLARAGIAPCGSGPSLPLLIDELFDVAEPSPVRLTSIPVEPPTSPGRLLDVAAPAATVPEDLDSREPGLVRRGLVLLGGLGPVRRRVWVALAAVAVLLGAALLLLPGGGPAAAVDEPTAPAAPATPRTASPTPAAPRALPAEDAVRRLLAARSECLTAADVRCLDRVEGVGGPLRRADGAALDAGTEPVRPDGDDVRMVSQGGGTAIARVGRAVVVAVREPDGWRLRDVVAEPPR